jgi:hypothetical protein
MDECPVVAPGDSGVEAPFALRPADPSIRLCLVRQIQADMRLRRWESRMQSMIVAVVLAASAVALAWLYSAGEPREGVSMAGPVLALHDVVWPGWDAPGSGEIEARRQVRRRA